MSRSTAVSVDLDDLGCYYAVHGVKGPALRLALTRWLPRFLELFDRLRVRATFFVIGRDLQADLEGQGEGAANLRAAAAAGHELASHSHAHRYDMSAWDSSRIEGDLRTCDALLRGLDARPRGFRAPGYTHSPAMLEAVAALGYSYDSSLLPSPAYYLGKAAVMAAMAATGRRSSSSLRAPGSFLGRTEPHHRSDVPLVELPMSVSRVLRLPIIGTTVLGGPAWLRLHLTRQALQLDHLHLELHAIDLGDARRDGVDADLPELKVPLAAREARLRALLRGRDETSTLAEIASRVTPISTR